MSTYFQVLKRYLTGDDFLKVSQDLLKHRVLSRDSTNKLASLDPVHLELHIKVRYLFKLILERVREDSTVYDRLAIVLSRLGREVKAFCETMGKNVDNFEEIIASNSGNVEDVELVEQDVSSLVEILEPGSYYWEEIGIALNLPKNKRENCRGGKGNVIRLTNILTTWILGSYEGARPATLISLREALASDTVGLGRLTQKVMINREIIDPLPITKKARYKLDITYQSCDTEVAEEKSTLLEVQVNGMDQSYQWSKDGQPLNDGTDYSGVNNEILYINKANQNMEGKYSCCVSRGSETECSDEMILSVIYPPEKKHLLEFYSHTEREMPQNSWPPVSNTTFINLVLIKQKPMSKCDYYTVRGDIDDILESKEVAEYEEVFREYREGALVLVEGRPGSGKTTLVHKLTKDWATGKKVLQGAKIVFLVTLRLVNVSGRDKTLLDLLQIFYGETLSKSIEHDLQECRGKGACFILDGLDEYPLESKKNLIIDQLLSTKTFPHSMVIVASRPVATQELKRYCETRIEVIGFSKDQIYNYVKSYPFSESPVDMAGKMAEFLDQHPNVLHICYLPVHASIICFLFGELEGNIPHRETLIYEQFTIATLLKHKALKGEQLRLMSLEDLSGEDKTLFNSICKLAFDMIVNSQQVVSKSDAKISLVLDSALELLTIEQTSKYYGREDFYSFSHLTFQEFLAAYHIREAQLEDENLVDRISKNVWKFYSGLSKSLENIKFLKLILDAIYFDFDYNFKVQCAYESQQAELCDYVVEDGVVRVTGNITSTDLIALGYVISESNKLVKSIIWKPDYSDCEGVKLFVSMATHRKFQSIRSLEIKCGTSEEFKAINCLLVHLPFLEKLDMSDVEFDNSKIECLTSEVTLPHLKVLKISLPFLSCSHPEKFIQLLAFNSKCMSQVSHCTALSKMEELLMEMKMDVTKLPAELSKMSSVSVQLKMDEYSTISKLAKSSAQPPISQSVITQAPPTSTTQAAATISDVNRSKSPNVARKETVVDKKPQLTPVVAQKAPATAKYQLAYATKPAGNTAGATQVQLAPGSGLALQTAQGNIVVYSVASSVNTTQTVSIVQGGAGSVVGNASTVSTNSSGQTFTIGVPAAYVDGSNVYQTVQLVPTAGTGSASTVVSGSQHMSSTGLLRPPQL